MAYFAGFFDADGNVGIHRNGKGQPLRLKCVVAQVAFGPVEAFQQRFGGLLNRRAYDSPSRANWSPIHVWRIDCAKAEAFLRTVVPYLILKRERAELALEFRALFQGEERLSRHPTPEEQAEAATRREDYRLRMVALNQRGRNVD